jgi:hypothetical protein
VIEAWLALPVSLGPDELFPSAPVAFDPEDEPSPLAPAEAEEAVLSPPTDSCAEPPVEEDPAADPDALGEES